MTEKFTLFRGRHSFKFGGRWLYQRQGFAYAGNEGILGHFDYNGSFTGFGFADFLLDQVQAKGQGGLVEPFTHLAHRIAIFAQDDLRIRNDLTLNLGITWEYLSPWVEKDDRQSNIDLSTGQLVLAGQNGASRALFDAYKKGFEPRVGFAWTPSGKWVVRGAFGIVQYMEGTGKNLRLTQNPPFNFEGRKVFDATTGAGTAATGFGDITPQVNGGPGTLYRIFAPDLRPQYTKQWNVFVERPDQQLRLRPGRLRREPLEPHGGPVRLQPAPAPAPVLRAPGPPSTSAGPLYSKNPDIGVTSGTNSIGVGAYDAVQASLRQRPTEGLEFISSYTYSKALSDNVGYYGVGWSQTAGPGLLLPRQLPSAEGLRPVALRHEAQLQPGRELRHSDRQGAEGRRRLERGQERDPGRLGTSTPSSRSTPACP
jgi:hypothetical protein